jgi:hypothetical protein
MVVGCGTGAFVEASDEERNDVFLPRFKQMVAEWEELGARPLCTFVDDVFKVGKTPDPFWSWYLIFEVDDLETAAHLVQAVRQPVDGIRLDRWVRLELRIGRPFYAREEKEPHRLIDSSAGGYRP